MPAQHARLLLAKLMCLVVCAAAAGPALGFELQEFETRNYSIYTDLPPDDVRPLAKHMDAVYKEYKSRFVGGGIGREKTKGKESLYLLSTRKAYIQYMATRGISATNSGGMFFYRDGKAALATWVYNRSRRRTIQVLQHEGFHQFAFRFLGNGLPLWVNEGLAEYFEQARLVKGKFKIGVAEPQRIHTITAAVKNKKAFTTVDLMALNSDAWQANMSHPTRSTLQYTQSWSLCHFLIHADKGRYQKAFNKYLDLIGTGRDHKRAFEKAFGTNDPAPLEARWKKYVLEDLEPDDYSVMLDRMEFLCDAALYFKGKKEMPQTLNAYQTWLQRTGFSTTSGDHTISAADKAIYSYRDSKNKQTPFEYKLDEKTGLPILSANSAKPRAIVQWIKVGDDLIYEVVFK